MEILALEASTTSVKAMLYHTDTHTFDVLTREHSATVDAAHRDAAEICAAVLALGREIAAGKRVDMISLCGTWHNLLVCDGQMNPLTPAYFWDFGGAAALCDQLRQDKAYTRDYYNRTGCMVNAIYPFFKLKWLLGQRPELRSQRFLSMGAYLTWTLTGQRVNSPCFLSGSGLLNTHTWKYDDTLWTELGLRPEQFCELVDYNAAYPLTAQAAEALGLKAGIPVIAANPDGAMNQTGAGALRPGVATLSIGTSGAMRMTCDKPVLPDPPSTWCYLSPKGWLSGAAVNGCCSCIDWARHKLFPAGTTYEQMEQGVSDGEDTPVFLPFLFGERCPGWNSERRGGFSSLAPHHSVADLYLAVQEGVLFNLYQCYTALTAIAGTPHEIKLSGGILNSKRWLQMCADIFGCTMTLDTAQHGSLLGACVVAMEKLGVLADARDYVPSHAGTVEPDPAKADLYQRKFERYLTHYNAESERYL